MSKVHRPGSGGVEATASIPPKSFKVNILCESYKICPTKMAKTRNSKNKKIIHEVIRRGDIAIFVISKNHKNLDEKIRTFKNNLDSDIENLGGSLGSWKISSFDNKSHKVLFSCLDCENLENLENLTEKSDKDYDKNHSLDRLLKVHKIFKMAKGIFPEVSLVWSDSSFLE